MEKRELFRLGDKKAYNVVLSAGGNINVFTSQGTLRLDQSLRPTFSAFVLPSQREGDSIAAPTGEGYLLAEGGKIFRQDRDGRLIGDFPFPSGQIRVIPGLRGPLIFCLSPQPKKTPSAETKLIENVSLLCPKSALAGEVTPEKPPAEKGKVRTEIPLAELLPPKGEDGADSEEEEEGEEESEEEVVYDTLVQALDFDLRPLFSAKIPKRSFFTGDFTSHGDFVGGDNTHVFFFRPNEAEPYFSVEAGFHLRSVIVTPKDELFVQGPNTILYIGADGRKKEEIKIRNSIIGVTLDLDGDLVVLEKEPQGLYRLYNLIFRRGGTRGRR